MKKYILSALALFLIIIPAKAETFKPATLFLSLPTVIVREAVYTKERADFLFYQGYKLETKELGATITTIDGGDKLKDSRVVINTNFSNLNTDKMEWSSWYATTSAPQITTLSNLTTVGTITSGTWNGTTITVSRGGTGSTTLSANNVLLGNGTSAIINVPAGTSGQFLTASTTGNPPYWASASVNQGDNYTWTGAHIFNGTTTANNLLISSSTITQYPTASTSIATKGFVDTFTTYYAATSTSFDPAGGTVDFTFTYPTAFSGTPTGVRVIAFEGISPGSGYNSYGTYNGSSYHTIWIGDKNAVYSGVRYDCILYFGWGSVGNYETKGTITALSSTALTLQVVSPSATDGTMNILIEVWKN